MPTPRGRRPPPTEGGGSGLYHKRVRRTVTWRWLASGDEAEGRVGGGGGEGGSEYGVIANDLGSQHRRPWPEGSRFRSVALLDSDMPETLSVQVRDRDAVPFLDSLASCDIARLGQEHRLRSGQVFP